MAWLAAAPAAAQDLQDGFLGTITLGESKRDVRTDTAAPVTGIDATEIKDRQAGTVAELIDTVPGVSLVNGATPQGSGINIRGFGANGTYGTDQKILIQVDGVTRGSEELYRIGNQLYTDPALYREAEVIRGTVGSFEYGSGVVGGVVRLETKDASDFTGGEPGLRFRQTLEFETNGTGVTNSSILAWQPTERLEFLVNYTNRKLDVQVDGYGMPINPAAGGINDPSLLVKGKLKFGQDDAHSITASYTRTEATQYNVPYDQFGLGLGFGNVDREVSSETAMLRYGFDPVGNDLVDLSFQVSYADEEIIQSPVPGTPPIPLLDADHRYETTAVTLKNRALFDTGAVAHSLVAGLEYIHRKRLDAASAPGGTDNRWAVFAVDEMTVGPLTITPAIRYEASDLQGSTPPFNGAFSNDALMGGLSLRYAFGNGLSVFGSAAYTEVLPPIDDLDTLSRVTMSEKSRTFELGAAFDREGAFRPGDRLAIKVNAYDTELWDVTSYVINAAPPVPPGPPVFEALDGVHLQGVEIEGSYALENGIYMDANANIVDGTQDLGPMAVANLGIASQDWTGLAANSLRLTVGRKFGDAYDVSWEVAAHDTITVNGVHSPGHVVHNLRATVAPKDGLWKDTEFRISVENLFDEQYTPRLSTRPAAGRNVKFAVARTF